MRARDLIGRKIVRVVQGRRPTREPNETGAQEFDWFIDCIRLDDGSELHFSVSETDFGEYEVKAQHIKPRARATRDAPIGEHP